MDPDMCVTSIRHGSKDLAKQGSEARVSLFWGEISLEWDDGKKVQIPLFDGKVPLLFRLSGPEESLSGRQCRHVTSGHFLAVAPRTWSRDGNEFREQELCSDPGYRAHFLTALKGDSPNSLGAIGPWRPGIGRTASLAGTTVFDHSDDGALFVGGPPKLAPDDAIEYARVGEERPGGWKGRNFLANDEPLADVLGGRKGRFFLRTYPPGERVIADSIAFRYWPALKEIRVNGNSLDERSLLVPDAEGHATASVQLAGVRGKITCANPEAQITAAGAVEVAPRPDSDALRLRIAESDSEVEVLVALPRIWWRLLGDPEGEEEWIAKPIQLTHSEFRRRTPCTLEVLLPRGVRQVSVGFERASRQLFQGKRVRSGIVCSIDLASLGDDGGLTEIDRRSSLSVLVLNREVNVLEVMPDFGPSLRTLRRELWRAPSENLSRAIAEVVKGTSADRSEIVGACEREAARAASSVADRRVVVRFKSEKSDAALSCYVNKTVVDAVVRPDQEVLWTHFPEAPLDSPVECQEKRIPIRQAAFGGFHRELIRQWRKFAF